MLRAIYELGKLTGNMLTGDEIGEVDRVLVFSFDDKLNYLELRTEDFKKSQEWIYLYKKKGNVKNQPGFTPTHVKTCGTLRKDRDLSVLKWVFSSMEELYGVSLQEQMTSAKEDFLRYLEDKELKDNERMLITVRVNGKYLGQIEEIRDKVQEAVGRWYEEERKGGYGICSLCGQEKRVIGDYMPITVYTVDNPAYAPQLNKSLAYNHMPACADCLEIVKRGFQALNLFRFTMAGFEYYFIPEAVLPGKEGKVQKLIEVFQDEDRRRSELGDGEIDPEGVREILGIEDDMRVHLLYLERRQSATRILHLIEDIFPSRLGYLYRLRKELVQKLMLDSFSYSTLKRLCPDRDGFFLLLRASFLGERAEIASILLAGLRGAGTKPLVELSYHFTSSYLFLKKAMEGKSMEEFKRLEEETPEDFFRKYFEGNEPLVGLALLGYLVASVEKVQYKRGYTPGMYLLFQEFNLDWSGVDRLLRELVNRLNRYELGASYYHTLNSALERLGHGERKGIKREDLNTALCVGYAVGYRKKKKEVEDEEA